MGLDWGWVGLEHLGTFKDGLAVKFTLAESILAGAQGKCLFKLTVASHGCFWRLPLFL